MEVRFNARSHVGMRREVNQDAYGDKQLGSATLLVVCDGMGGHAAGEVASQLGVQTIVATFDAQVPPDQGLRQAFATANQRIYSEGRGSMGTTGVAALFLANTLYVANVGDSRAYLVREGQIRQISQDHSFVSDQVAAGLMTPEQARASNIRNIITRALGHSAEVEVDFFPVDLQAGDTVLLSSDGMHGLINDEEIAEVASMLPLDEAANRLVDLANERGGTDNITVVIARVDQLDRHGPADATTEPALTSPRAVSVATEPLAPSLERPLSRLGLTLASLTLLLLFGLGGFVMATSRGGLAPPPVPASSAAPSATAPTAPSATPPPASSGTPPSAPSPATPPTPDPSPGTPAPTRPAVTPTS